MGRPKMDKVTESGVEILESLTKEMRDMNLDEIEKRAPEVDEIDPQTIMSKKNLEKYDAPFIKPSKSFATKSKPCSQEEKERKRGWEYIKCVAENIEVPGELVSFWHNKFLGDPYYFWNIPVNIPIYIPRFIAEHLASRHYHVFHMRDYSNPAAIGDVGQDGAMTVKSTKKRIDCRSVGFGF